MNLAIIPARGGSKRIPRKNIRLFGGRPMIAWSIEAAQQSGCFDRILVSTDDSEIAEVARAWGAEVPFVRPPELSDDHTGTGPVILHAMRWNERDTGRAASKVCCIYATAPFLLAKDLRDGLTKLNNSDADFVFSVTNYAFPIQRAIRLSQDQRVSMFQPEYFTTRSQDLVPAWHDAGQFYWGHAQAWFEERPMFQGATVAFPLPRYRVQDIDTPEDWERAEWMLKAQRSGHASSP